MHIDNISYLETSSNKQKTTIHEENQDANIPTGSLLHQTEVPKWKNDKCQTKHSDKCQTFSFQLYTVKAFQFEDSVCFGKLTTWKVSANIMAVEISWKYHHQKLKLEAVSKQLTFFSFTNLIPLVSIDPILAQINQTEPVDLQITKTTKQRQRTLRNNQSENR